MSALVNPLHTQSTPKKSADKASRSTKLNQYGRDPNSPSERLRASSDYDKETGYAPFFHSFLADLPRLSSGNSCTLLLLTLWAKSAGRGAPRKGNPRPDWTLALSVEDLAQICCCDVRTVEREIAALDKRGLAEVRRPAKGQVEARLKYREWEALPNYKSEVLEMPVKDEPVEELKDEDEAKPGNQRVTGKKPVKLAAGTISKAFPVSCGVKTFRHKAEGPVDMEFSCVIQAGELLVVSRFPDDWQEKVRKSISSYNVSNDLTSPPRHGCREDEAKTERKTAAVNHPRAAELNRIFDPVLAHSGASLLSMDGADKLRLQACEAIQDCDHEYLAQFVANKGKIRTVTIIPKICEEALASWKASKVLTLAGAPLAREQKNTKKGFAETVLLNVARRLARDGKV